MLKSMTGFGRSESILRNKKISVEIKTLNSKQVDLSVKIPGSLREYEFELRNRISSSIKRGKADFLISIESTEETHTMTIQADVVKNYYEQINAIHKSLGLPLPDSIILSTLRLPDSLKTEKQEICPEEWELVSENISEALDNLDKYRVREGDALEKDILFRVGEIEALLKSVLSFESKRIETFRSRLKKRLEEVVSGDLIDSNRLEQELIYYLEKFDITEEKVRLSNHCRYFNETMADEEDTGRKLGFIAQEMGREINTLGSKANDSDIQKIVVRMKDELEKIKEQILNIL
jgi:uncharacterized protein (TIGR00255 family)